MKKIEISLFRKIVATLIFLVLETLLLLIMFYICREWLCISKSFVKIMVSIVVATPISILAYKAILESWTGEKIE